MAEEHEPGTIGWYRQELATERRRSELLHKDLENERERSLELQGRLDTVAGRLIDRMMELVKGG